MLDESTLAYKNIRRASINVMLYESIPAHKGIRRLSSWRDKATRRVKEIKDENTYQTSIHQTSQIQLMKHKYWNTYYMRTFTLEGWLDDSRVQGLNMFHTGHANQV